MDKLPKWTTDEAMPTIKTLMDGSLIVAQPLLTAVKSTDNLVSSHRTRKTRQV